MSTNLRRTVRPHRATANGDENATTRSRIPAPGGLAGTKPLAAGTASRSTAASRAKAQGASTSTATAKGPAQKRKRGAFVEVANSDQANDDGKPKKPSVAALEEKRKLRAVCEDQEMAEPQHEPFGRAAVPPTRIASQRRKRTESVEEKVAVTSQSAADEPSAKKKQRTAPPQPPLLEEALDTPPAYLAQPGSPKADPLGDRWTDIDIEDADDPGSVSEYATVIFQHMLTIELTTLPKPSYIHSQKEFGIHARNVLVDWIVELHSRFRLLPETLFLTLNVMDRFLSTRAMRLSKAQLVGVVALLVACKYEESMVPSIDDLVIQTGEQYTREELIKAEGYLLKTLNFDLNTPTPVAFLRRVNKANDMEVQSYTLSKYLMEIGCVEHELIGVRPSLLAASALWLARLVLDQEDWTDNLAHYSTYGEDAILPIANLMVNYVLKSTPPHPCFFKKYASKRYMKASVYMRGWVNGSWPDCEDGIVNLTVDLPRIKEEIRRARQLHEEAQAAELQDDEQVL